MKVIPTGLKNRNIKILKADAGFYKNSSDLLIASFGNSYFHSINISKIIQTNYGKFTK